MKNKLPHADKIHCLKNCLSIFGRHDFFLFADNCQAKTLEAIRASGVERITETSLGNAKAWRYVVEYALKSFSQDTKVYLLEDDYLHLSDAPKLLQEGLAVADYVSLYDHPDKYMHKENGGNPFVEGGGEKTKVLLTPSSHWKYTNSTTMTFATTIKVLKEDQNTWWKYTESPAPQDFTAFSNLCGYGSWKNRMIGKKRTLITSIPGRATHIETKWLSPLVDWSKV